MHRTAYSIRRISLAELPSVTDPGGVPRPATDQELLNLGLVHLHEDLYSCVDQYRRDPDTLAWAAEGPESPGTVVTEGSLRARHAQLPADVAAQVLRAQVIRSDDPAAPAALVALENLAEARTMLDTYVGDVPGANGPAPLVDLSGPAAVLDEALRLVELPGNGIERHVVPMAMVDAGDVVEADRIIPHRWAGESPH